MSGVPFDAENAAVLLVWTPIVLASAMATLVVLERAAVAIQRIRYRRAKGKYLPLVRRALRGDAAAVGALVSSTARHRLVIAALLIEPLIDNRDPARIARTRAIVDAMSLIPVADRYLRSWWWWRRALALRALGLLQVNGRTAAIVAALDDPNADVRAAALDALTDLRDPASLRAVVVRLHDASLHRGRRAAALAAFGDECETFLLELAEVDPAHRVDYARALAICGSGRSRPVLCGWMRDPRAEVRGAALEALAHVGLDQAAACLAVAALESVEPSVRAMAAFALHGWRDAGEAAARLGRHLDDEWPVAVHAARTLRSMGSVGIIELQGRASRPDLTGVLARQMLWQEHMPC